MSTPIAMASDLGTYLGDPNIDLERATLILQLSQNLCELVISPLPESAMGILLGVASRAFVNAQAVASESVGPFSVQYSQGGQGAAVRSGGLYLSRADTRALRLLAGRGGAFSIDPTPADAGESLSPWDTNTTWLTGVPLAEEQTRQ